MSSYKILPLAALSLLALGCSDQKASEGNFREALDAYFAQEPTCVMLKLATDDRQRNFLGEEELRPARTDKNGEAINAKAFEQMKILVDAGIYAADADENKNGRTVAVYRLTDEGKEYVHSGWGAEICVGNIKVKDIEFFTVPAQGDGKTLSFVKYTGALQLHPWAEKLLEYGDEDIREKLDKLREGEEGVSALVLTNRGWRERRELQ